LFEIHLVSVKSAPKFFFFTAGASLAVYSSKKKCAECTAKLAHSVSGSKLKITPQLVSESFLAIAERQRR